ncbi:tail fiber protein [Clostridium phage CP3]|nr:tail fiber protein [Clostridium phage CP3]
MPSTGKTPTLGLNKWELTDKPKMNDFNKDNENIENFAAEHKQKMTEVEKKSKSNENRLDALRVGTINRLEWYNSESYTGPGNITSITDAPTKRRGFKWSGMSTGPQTLEIKTLPIEPNSDYVLAFLEDIEGSFTSYEIKLAYTNGGQQYKSIVKQGSTPQSNGYNLKTHKFSIPSGATDTKIQFVVQGATSSTSLKVLNILLARGNVVPDYNLAPEDVLKRLDLLFEKDTSLQNQVNQKAAKTDVLLKVSAPLDRDCNSFKDINTFCTFDTGDGNFKNTPDGTLSQGSAQVFMVVNRGHHSTRLQQEFIYLYPKDSVARYKRNFDGTRWGNWYKEYDSANKPTAEELGVAGVNMPMADTDLNNHKNPGFYWGYQNMVNAPVPNGVAIMEVVKYNNDCVLQRFTSVRADSNHTTYIRTCYSNKWSSWKKIYDEGNKPTPADIGAIPQIPIRITQDLNTFTTPGLYIVDRATHAPQSYGRLLVLGWDNDQKWVTQVFYADITNKVYVRCSTNNTATEWTSWAEQYSTSFKPTPQDIGASPSNHNHNKVYYPIPKQAITDFNSGIAITEGQHLVSSSTAIPNSPPLYAQDGSSIYGILHVYVSVGDSYNGVNNWIWQDFHDTRGNHYWRYKINNADWSPWRAVYNSVNKPTPQAIGAVATEGDGVINGTLELRKADKLIRFATERGWILKQGGTAAETSLDLVSETDGKAFRVLEPSGKKGIYMWVSSGGTQFNVDGNSVYHQGFKPTPSDIGAASSSHNHDSAYLGKTATAANSNKLKNWDLAEGSNNFVGIPFIPHDGVMEVGRMVDFHEPGTNKDFNTRLESINGALKCWQDFSAENLWARKYMRVNDWYGGSEDGRFYYKQDGKGLYTENVENLYVKGSPVAKGDYWDVGDNTRVVSLGGGLRLVRQIVKTGYANSGGGVNYTIHFPKAWNWVLPISLVSHNYNDASNNTSGYCTIDYWNNSYLNGGCYQMVAGKPTQIILTYLATE